MSSRRDCVPRTKRMMLALVTPVSRSRVLYGMPLPAMVRRSKSEIGSGCPATLIVCELSQLIGVLSTSVAVSSRAVYLPIWCSRGCGRTGARHVHLLAGDVHL